MTTTKRKSTRRAPKGEGSLFLRGAVWAYKFPDGHTESTGKRIKSEAVEWKQKRLAEVLTGELPVKLRRVHTVNELLDDYLAFMRLRKLASVDNVAMVMAKHLRPTFGDRNAASLKTRDFEEYREEKSKTVSQTSINRHLSYLNSAFRHAHKRQTPRKLTELPYIPMADESGNVRLGFLDVAGYRAVLKRLPASLAPLFVCAYHVPSRKGELKNIEWSQVDFEESMIVLEHGDTKGGEGRSLPIYGDMLKALTDQKALRDTEFPDCPHVFFWHADDCRINLGLHGGNRTAPGSHIKTFNATWNAVVNEAGLPGLLFHDLRRSAVRNMRKAGVDQQTRMKIGGWKTTETERRYNIQDLDDTKAAAARMTDWFRGQTAPKKVAKKTA